MVIEPKNLVCMSDFPLGMFVERVRLGVFTLGKIVLIVYTCFFGWAKSPSRQVRRGGSLWGIHSLPARCPHHLYIIL